MSSFLDRLKSLGTTAVKTAAGVLAPNMTASVSLAQRLGELAKMKPVEPAPVQQFRIGAGLSNVMEVKPGPRIATGETIARGEEIKVTPVPVKTSQVTTAKAEITKQTGLSKKEQENLPLGKKLANLVFKDQPTTAIKIEALTRIKTKDPELLALQKEELMNVGLMSAGIVGIGGKIIKKVLPSLGKKVISGKIPPESAQRLEAELLPSSKQEVPTYKPTETRFGKDIKERKFITSVRETVAEPTLKISGEYVPRNTDELAIKARNLVKDDINLAEQITHGEIDDNVVATTAELIKHYDRLAKGAKTTAEKNSYLDKIADTANRVSTKLTESGRTVQAASILGRMTPEGQLRYAAREIQKFNEGIRAAKGGLFGLKKEIPELTGVQSEEILSGMKKVTEMPDGAKKAKAFWDIQNQISDFIPSSTYKKMINLWKAGLLTGIKTSGLNTFSNLSHGISEVVKDIPATMVDSLASLFTGKRTLAFTLKGTGKGTLEGIKRGFSYLKTGFSERDIASKLDFKRVNFGKNKIAKTLQSYEDGVFRLMGSEDQPFYYGAKTRSLFSQAIAQGKNSGKKGIELKSLVNNLVTNPTDAMLINATKDAEIAVFQNRTILGEAAKMIQKIPGGEIAVPFARTPASVAMQLINYSPVGIVKTIAENIGKGKFDQRMFAQGIGRGITGTGVLYLGKELYKKRLISLGYPKNERERKQWELEGRKENAIKIDGRWRSFNVLGPAGLILGVGGYYQQAMDTTGSHAEAFSQAIFGAGKTLTEQTFLKGLNQFLEAISDPERSGLKLLANLTGSLVPTILGDVARATDMAERETSPQKAGFLAPLKSRIPGMRQTLQTRKDIFGETVQRGGNAIETMIDPTRPTRIKSNVLIEELRRLANAGQWATPTQFADEKTYNILTPNQKVSLQERAGSILESKLERLVVLPEYKKLSDEEKKNTVQDFTEKARLVSRAEAVQILTAGLKGEQLKARLSELKQSGFLIKSVFEKWQELYLP